MIKEAILKLARGEDISYKIARSSMDEIMNGEATDVQMSAYLTALSLKGETISEITASAESMRNHCVKLLHDMDVLEIVGTGGDGSNSFNISTISSIVISAGGVPVAKHGNRAASSACGAADVLESLGVNIEISPEESTSLLEEIGICFLFAQNYHISMKYVAPIRRELGIRTIFNILGPLSNPAGANREVMGVYNESLVLPLAQVLCNLGLKNAMVVYGQDGLDEISISAPTTICEIKDGEFTNYELKPEDFGLERSDKNEIVGGSPKVNAQIALDILNGEKSAKRDAILLNSGAGLYIGGKVNSIEKGIDIAAKVLDNGKAKNQLDKFINLSNQFQLF
ncbi:anthranilate phosphoribosyltransferase [Methanobrevibacter curvatus]|uniref:Anthranilate phosphoribosyltransferase n=1 Tax=Methanobrevibacter curvatus TaxID=49547 RepID=A0A166C4M4_9EURY|nr:anthranilate phosphoribosyltransferase [Methanobrevibacter curvatus]KZX14123.1 anthranilate phosphoribosyltransferase [Methanobrevibacter curvatus]